MKSTIALMLVAGAMAQADPETTFFSDEREPSNWVGIVSKPNLLDIPDACVSVSPWEGTDYCDFEFYVGDVAPDGTITLLALDVETEFFGILYGVEIGDTGGFEGGSAVELSGFAITDAAAMTINQMPAMVRYAPDGRLWTADYTECDTEELTQFWWGTIDLESDPAVFTGHFQITSPDGAQGGYYEFGDDGYSFTCPWVGEDDDGPNDFGFGILGTYLYLNYFLEYSTVGFWAISLETEGVYTRTLENMLWQNWYQTFGNDVGWAGATDRGQGRFYIGANDESSITADLYFLFLQSYDFSCFPTQIYIDPTPFLGDVDDLDWEIPVSAGREFYYCAWPNGVCEDGVVNENFVVIGDGLVESLCSSVPTGFCGYTYIGCADGYIAHGFIEGKESCNRTASEIGWTSDYWGASTDLFECEFGAGGGTTSCPKHCTATAQVVEYHGAELQFQVTCTRCDDPAVIIIEREERFTPVTDTTGYNAAVVAVGCGVGDVDCCLFVLNRASCEAGVELDFCFCGLDIIDCPDPDCDSSKKGLLGLLGLLGLIPLSLCSLLLLLCLIRRKRAGPPVPVATFDACAPPVFDAGLCTAAPTFAAAGAPGLGYPGTWVA